MTITTVKVLTTPSLGSRRVNTSRHSKARSRNYVSGAFHMSHPRFSFPVIKIKRSLKANTKKLTWRYSKWLSTCLFLNIALILSHCLAPAWWRYIFPLGNSMMCWLTRLTLDVVVIPVLAGSDALLGPIVFDALHSFKLEVGAHSSLEISGIR